MTRSSDDEGIREAVERSRSGAPAAGEVVRDRFSSDEIFERITVAADDEIRTGFRELFSSGLAAGFAITLTFLLYASVSAKTHSDILGALLYPLGFVYIILGDYQLYTENTLPPVALVLERLASIPALLTVWTIVLVGNLLGGLIGSTILAHTNVFSPAAMQTAIKFSQKAVETGWTTLFFKAAFAGLLVAGVVWIDYSARDTISRLIIVYTAFLGIPLGNLFHVVVTATEAMFLMSLGKLAITHGVVDIILPVLLGNTFGGILLVTVVNYFQTADDTFYDEDGRKLTLQEWVFGRNSDFRTAPPTSNDD